ncbi:MAG TPA: hypothetical protein VOA41_10760 [Candidatus Dormibacteraeota bacterium]|nr:hypothetical protein [Candidatus Dormibacteraeota bacterium]
MSLDPRAIQIHTDGSCYMEHNRISGRAAFVVYPDHLCLPEFQIVDYGCAENTNIRMELMACAKGGPWQSIPAAVGRLNDADPKGWIRNRQEFRKL